MCHAVDPFAAYFDRKLGHLDAPCGGEIRNFVSSQSILIIL